VPDAVATRSALLELEAEARFTREGHEFLDQKRMLIAGELLAWLARHEKTLARFDRVHEASRRALAEAIALHGMEELGHHPAGTLDFAPVAISRESFLGVTVVRARGEPEIAPPSEPAANPSPEARRCRERFTELAVLASELAVASGNVLRLLREYRRTERRARALENVILPELGATVRRITEQLDEQDYEEAARLRTRR
jgi:V/A-type H+/Na+-transporting ATPase subunit D